jgi:3-hydroxyacyl-[acyl-carrier-protein] dehydratase
MSDETLGVADITEILRLLPHRYPFLLIDRVIDIRGEDHGIGIKNVTMNEPQFGGSRENPVMPSVLVIEGIAQTAAVLALRLMPPAERPRNMFFMTIDKAKFRKPARPGDTLEYHVDKVAQRRNIWVVPGRGQGRRRLGRRGWRLRLTTSMSFPRLMLCQCSRVGRHSSAAAVSNGAQLFVFQWLA